MAPSALSERRVRARADEEEYEEEDEFSSSGSEQGEEDGSPEGSDGGDVGDMNDRDSDSGSEADGDGDDDVRESLNNISFGALAKAQASLGTKRKRPSTENEDDNPAAKKTSSAASALADLRQRMRESNEKLNKEKGSSSKSGRSAKDIPSRTSKHAPQALPTNRAVSRKRIVVEPAATQKYRDPRFDATIASSVPHRATAVAAANKNYSFLSDYRDSEIQDLKASIKRSKNEAEKERLKRDLMSLEAKKRADEAKAKEQQLVSEHRKKEKGLVKDGKKNPYFLKKGEVRKMAEEERWKNMGAKQRDKALKRKTKKIAGKEKKAMPMARRSAMDY